MTNVRMRRFFLLVGFLCLTMGANAWQDPDSRLYFEWISESGKTARVIKAPNDAPYSGAYTIPEKIKNPNNPDEQDVEVKQIISEAFRGATNLTEVTIYANITNLRSGTFQESGLTSIVLPPSLETIEEKAFYSTKNLTTISLPEHVTVIGNGAFQNSGLVSINLPASLETIGANAFNGSKLSGITIPESVTSIGGSAFNNCSSLKRATFANAKWLCNFDFAGNASNPLYYAHKLYWTGDENEVTGLVIPSDVATVKQYAFVNCTSLIDVTLQEGVTTIGENAFAGCSALKSVNIPSSLTGIANDAFKGCNKLEKANFTSELSLCSINYANLDASPLYKAKHLYINNEEKDAISIPVESLKYGNTIRTYILAGAYYINRLNMPQSDIATHVEPSAFLGCNFKDVNFNSDLQATTMEYDDSDSNPFYSSPNANLLIKGETRISLTFTKDVKNKAFPNAKWLRTVTISGEAKNIGDGAFMNCTNLTTVHILSDLESIGEDAFNGCKQLQDPQFPDSLNNIKDRAFKSCQAFKNISIPNGCSLGAETFYDCTNLLSVVLPNDLTTIYNRTFYKCFKLSTISIPNSVTSIDTEAFWGCEKLLSLPLDNVNSHLTTIGDNAFYGCTGFTSLVIPNNVETILDRTFQNCKNITMVSLPSNIDFIGVEAFAGCTKLKNVYILRNDPPNHTGEGAFGEKDENDKINMTLYLVPDASNDFNKTEPWMSFANKGTQGQYTLTFYIDDVEKRKETFDAGSVIPAEIKEWAENPVEIDKAAGDVISAWSQAVPETMPSNDLTLYAYVSLVREIQGTDGNYKYKYKYRLQPEEKLNKEEEDEKDYRATLIGVSQLDENYTNIKIPAEVTYDDVTYPVIAIGDSAFYSFDEKSQIQKVSLPASKCITEVGKVAFKGCNNLGEVENFDGVTLINESVFQDCSNLQTITLSGNVTKIGRLAFSGCSTLNLTTLPSQLETISYQAFANSGIEKVTVAKNTELEDEVFKGCTKLETVDFEDGYNAPLPKLFFWNCTALKDVTLKGTMGSIHEGAFKGCTNLTTIDIPTGITQLGNDVFMGCTNLSKVSLPETGLTTISQSAFSGCTALTDIKLPAAINSIRQKAFAGCTSLVNITVQPTDPPTTDPPTLIENAFDNNTYQNAKLYVDNNNIEKYKNQNPWNKFGDNIVAIGKYVLTYILDADTIKSDSILVGDFVTPRPEAVKEKHEFSGWLGEPQSMPGEDVTVTGKFQYQIRYYENEVDEAKRLLGDELHTYYYGDVVTLPVNELKRDNQRYDIIGLTENPMDEDDAATFQMTMPAEDLNVVVKYKLAEQEDTINNIIYKVFLLEDRAEVIGNTITSKTSVVIPDHIEYDGENYKVTAIQDNAFANNKLINGMTLPSTIESIGVKAFYDNKFETITIPAKVNKIGNEAFHQCTSLQTVIFASDDNIKTLPFNLFRNCMALENITVPSSVTKIEKSVFSGCSNLKSVTIKSTELPTADDSSFDQTHYDNVQLKVPETVTNLSDKPWTKFHFKLKGEESVENQCNNPTISYNKGNLIFQCTTPEAEIVSKVVCSDATNVTTDNPVTLFKIYTITAYARKDGMSNSDKVVATITWRNGKPLFSDNITVIALDDPVDILKGDVDGNGVVDTQDAIQVVRIYLGKE